MILKDLESNAERQRSWFPARRSRGRDRARGVRQTLHCWPHVRFLPLSFMVFAYCTSSTPRCHDHLVNQQQWLHLNPKYLRLIIFAFQSLRFSMKCLSLLQIVILSIYPVKLILLVHDEKQWRFCIIICEFDKSAGLGSLCLIKKLWCSFKNSASVSRVEFFPLMIPEIPSTQAEHPAFLEVTPRLAILPRDSRAMFHCKVVDARAHTQSPI